MYAKEKRKAKGAMTLLFSTRKKWKQQTAEKCGKDLTGSGSNYPPGSEIQHEENCRQSCWTSEF